jgi:ATP phosphoribosyltransferase regulatory subunit
MSGPNDACAAIRALLEPKAPLWIAPPLLQPAAIYLELSGDDIRRRAFLIEDHAQGELCLRPDLTVPAVRAALAMEKLPPLVAYEGLVFRRQHAGSTRETEFLQIGAEWLGHGDMDAAAEAEIIAAAIEACRAAGAEPVLRLGDRGIVHGFVAALGLSTPWAQRIARALSHVGGISALRQEKPAGLEDEGAGLAEALAHAPEDHAEAALEDVLNLARITRIGDRPAREIVQRLRQREELAAAPAPSPAQFDLLEALMRVDGQIDAAGGLAAASALAKSPALKNPSAAQAVIAAAAARFEKLRALTKPPQNVAFAPALGRAVAYYDGFVFELEAPSLGERASLGGGGRYDGLARALAAPGRDGGADLRAAGFAVRPRRLEEARP